MTDKAPSALAEQRGKTQTLLASSRVLFQNDGGEFVIERGWLRLEGELIVATGRGKAPAATDLKLANLKDTNLEFIDLGDLLLTPAFVDPHTHLALVALRGLAADATAGNVVEDIFYNFEAHLTPEDVRAFARLGAYESILSGVGVVWDHYFFGEALAEGIAETGLAAVVAPTLQDLAGPVVSRGQHALHAAKRETETLATAAWKARGIYAAVGPHATDTVSAPLWTECIAQSKQLNIPIHAHLAQSVEEMQRMRERHDTTPARWLDSLGVFETRGVFAHGLYLDDGELALLAQKSEATLVVAPWAQLLFAFMARVDRWTDHGINWTVATDAAAANDGKDVRSELRLLHGAHAFKTSFSSTMDSFLAGDASPDSVWQLRQVERQHAAPFESLLSRVWQVSGSLHPAFQAGVLASGALANVLAWDLNHPSFWPGGMGTSTDVTSTSGTAAILRALVLGNVGDALSGVFLRGRQVGTLGDVSRSIRNSSAYDEARREAEARLAVHLARL